MIMRTRWMFNDRKNIVEEMLDGYIAAHSKLIALSNGLVVRASRKPEGRVGLVVANGTGHEPAMIGWVGPGLLDVNVPGPIFSSPGPAQIVAGIKEANRGAGVLLLVSSHAGDIMNAFFMTTSIQRHLIEQKTGEGVPDCSSSGRSSVRSRSGGPISLNARRWRGVCGTARDPSAGPWERSFIR